MPRIRFWAVEGDDVNADGGFIEVLPGGWVVASPGNAWMLDALPPDGSGLRAPEDIRDVRSATTRPARGFRPVAHDSDGSLVFRAEPSDGWDGAHWLDRIRYHFRTPYQRPGDVEPEEPHAADAPWPHRLDPRVDADEPSGDWVDPVDYWLSTGECWENIPEDRQHELQVLLDEALARRE